MMPCGKTDKDQVEELEREEKGYRRKRDFPKIISGDEVKGRSDVIGCSYVVSKR